MKVNYKGRDVNLPEFLIVGALKSGTTSLHYYLKQHPEIFMPSQKELRYFGFSEVPSHPEGNKRLRMLSHICRLDDYINHFKEAKNGHVIGEACPFYLYIYNDTIRDIKRVYNGNYKELKIIIILRNPADRAWSQFWMIRREGMEHRENFNEIFKKDADNRGLIINWLMNDTIDYIGNGMYYEKVRSFMEEFPHVKIFLYEDLCANAPKVVKELYRFLGVDEGFIPNVEERYNISGDVVRLKWLNTLLTRRFHFRESIKSFIPADIRHRIKLSVQSKITERKKMPGNVRKQLIERHYKNDILRLQGLIDRDLSAWLDV